MSSVATAAATSTAGRAWNSQGLLATRAWQPELPAAVGREFARFCRRHPEQVANLDGFEPPAGELPKLRAFATGVRSSLLTGEGLAWVRGLPRYLDAAAQWKLFYLAFGSLLGKPMTQYGRLYPVKDLGGSYRDSAIPVSMTSADTGFHTDSSARDTLPDLVGLLCEQPSSSGGASLVSNALHALSLLGDDPETVALLQEPYVRDLVTPGVEKTAANLLRNRFPIYGYCPRRRSVVFRYMRYWIERGQEKAGAPLDPRRIQALDRLDQALAAADSMVTFELAAGDILWVNNYLLAHSRTAYVDQPGNTRLLHRMWIDTLSA